MRKWRPPDVSADDQWTVNHQIVVPRAYRPEILNLASETPMSGHLGVNMTYHKILNHFFWPVSKSDVSQHCKSCHACQMVENLIRLFQKLIYSPFLPLMSLLAESLLTCRSLTQNKVRLSISFDYYVCFNTPP